MADSILPAPLVPGQSFTVVYPFIRDTYERFDGDEDGHGTTTVPTWKPATRPEMRGSGDHAYDVVVADGVGTMTLTVVSVHKPGKYPTRVFFTRRFVNPDGKSFGKGKLHIKTEPAFRWIAAGFKHEYELEGCAECAALPWCSRDHREHIRAEPTKRFPFGMNADDHHESCAIRTSRDGWDANCDCGVLS